MADTPATLQGAPESKDTAAAQSVPAYSWYVLFVMAATFGVGTLDRGIMAVVLEPVRAEFALNDAQLGLLAGFAFGLTFTIFAVPAGMLADRTNRRNLLAGAVAVWSFVTALGGFAQSYIQLVLARMGVGASESAAGTALSILTDYFPERRRPMAMGLYIAGGNIGMVTSFVLGGWVAHEWGWRAAFFTAGVPGLVIAALIFFTVREPLRGASDSRAHAAGESAPSLLEAIRFLLKTRSAVHIFLGNIITAAVIASVWSWLGSLLVRVHGVSIRDAGLLIAGGVGVMGVVGSLLGAFISDRLAKRSLTAVLVFVAVADALMAPLGIAMSMAPTLTIAIVFMMAIGVTKSTFTGPPQGILMSLVTARMRGVTAVLLNLLGMLVGYGVGPMLTGVLSQLFGGGEAIRYALSTCFLLSIWSGVHYWFASRSLARDLAAVASKP